MFKHISKLRRPRSSSRSPLRRRRSPYRTSSRGSRSNSRKRSLSPKRRPSGFRNASRSPKGRSKSPLNRQPQRFEFRSRSPKTRADNRKKGSIQRSISPEKRQITPLNVSLSRSRCSSYRSISPVKRRSTRRSSNSPHLNGSERRPHSPKDISRRRVVEKDDRYVSPSPVKQPGNINTRNSTDERMKKSEFSNGGSGGSRSKCNESDVLSARRQRFASDKHQPEQAQRSIDLLDIIMDDDDQLLQTDLKEPTTGRQRRDSSIDVDVHQTTTFPKRIVKLRNPDVSNSSTPDMTSKKVYCCSFLVFKK